MVRRLIFWLLVAAFIYFITTQVAEIKSVFAALARARPQWLAAAAALILVYHGLYVASFKTAFHAVEVDRRYLDLVPLIFGMIFVNVAAPTGGVAGYGLLVDDAGRRGYSSARTVSGIILQLINDSLALLGMLSVGLLFLAHGNRLQPMHLAGAGFLLLLIAGMTAVMLLALQAPGRLERLLVWLQRSVNRLGRMIRRPELLPGGWAQRFALDMADAAQAIISHPARLAVSLAVIIAAHLTAIGCLNVLFLAFYGPLPAGVLVAGYAVGILFWFILPEQALGVIESAMVLTYFSLGVPIASAVAVALTFRALIFWLPVVAGFLLLRRFRIFDFDPRRLTARGCDRSSYAYGDIEMEVGASTAEVDRQRWNARRDPTNLLTDLDYLQAIARANVMQCEQRFFEFSDPSGLLCALYGFIWYSDVADLSGGFLGDAIHLIRRAFPGFLRYKSLEFGSPVSLGLAASFDPAQNGETWQAIVRLVKAYACQEQIKLVLFRDFEGEPVRLEDALKGEGFVQVLSVPAARMPIHWETFDAYLADLKRKYRYKVNYNQRLKQAAQIRTVIGNQDARLEAASDFARLSKMVQEHSSELPRERIGEDYQRAMLEHFRERSCWIQYFLGDELVGYVHFIVYHGALITHAIGMDYRVSSQAALYFNVLYDVIHYAIENNIESIDWGVSTYEAKSSTGASIVPQRFYLLHENFILRSIARLLPFMVAYQAGDCHYAFKGNRYQSIWEGNRRLAKIARLLTRS